MNERLIAILRVKNEAAKLDRCLDSMPFLDGLVVVDNGSVDTTVEIASARGATVLHTTGLDASRDLNLAYTEAARQGATWCVWMDADEVWETAAADRFRDLLGPGPINGWIFRIFPFVLSTEFYRIDGPWAQFSLQGQLRLFRVQDKIHWADRRPAHPGAPRGLQGALGKSDLRVKHWTIETEEELLRKRRFYVHDTEHFEDRGQGLYRRWIE